MVAVVSDTLLATAMTANVKIRKSEMGVPAPDIVGARDTRDRTSGSRSGIAV